MLFLTLVFAATSYPLGSMVVVVVASVTGVATARPARRRDRAVVRGRSRLRLGLPRQHGAQRRAVHVAVAPRRAPPRGAGRALADRPAHRLPEPPRLLGALRRRAGRGRRGRAHPARPQRLQVRQRPARARGGRRAAALGRLDAQGRCCAARTPPAAWAATSSRCCCRACRPARRAPSPTARWPRWPSASAPPPVSPATPPTGPPATSCTGTPTPSSTAASRPRAPADPGRLRRRCRIHAPSG